MNVRFGKMTRALLRSPRSAKAIRRIRNVRKLYFLVIAALLTAPAAIAGTADGVEAFNTKQFVTALKELTPAAKAGDPEAIYYLALMYSRGFGVNKNPRKALKLYGQAAELGHVPAQKEYGTALAIGDGAEQDVAEGLKWLMIAARTGNQDAGVMALRFSELMNRRMVLTARRKAGDWISAFKKAQAAAQK
jgi:TPR repeat protein